MDPHTKPKQTDKRPAPLCHAGCIETKKAFRAAFESFVESYKEAYKRLFKSKVPTDFPDGGILPTAWCVPSRSG